MKPREGVYWAAFMFGAIVVFLSFQSFGLHHLLVTIAAMVGGFALGTAAERAYVTHRKKKQVEEAGLKPVQFDDKSPIGRIDISCRSCDWQGDMPYNGECPRCGQRI